jgi:hypothetical protein
MYSAIATASFIGLSCLSVVSAAPFTYANNPIGNGFPTLNAQALSDVEVAAQGQLSNAPPAAPGSAGAPHADSLTSLSLVAFNELTEVAFFTELIANITSDCDGFQIEHRGAREFILRALHAVQAQEELHATNANNALLHFSNHTIQPCEYNFPVSTFEEAIGLASTFTDLILGTLQNVETHFANADDDGLIQGVASIIGQEGEQNGFYRQLLDKIPCALPFLTTSSRPFAFSALQGFVVPGSCPSLGEINLPIFAPLTIVTPTIAPKSQTLQFSIPLPSPVPASWKADYSGLSVTYINQQNLPVNEPISNATVSGSTLSFSALFPFNETTFGAAFGNGLTIATVTNSTGPFTSADAVANATVAAPGLIEIN